MAGMPGSRIYGSWLPFLLEPGLSAMASAYVSSRTPVAARPERQKHWKKQKAMNSLSLYQARPELTEADLHRLAPSTFAAGPSSGRSRRYAFAPTGRIVAELREIGWKPVLARQQQVRIEGRQGFQKHLIRFERREVLQAAGAYVPELVLVNSHDGSSAFHLHLGIFRFICSNGLIVADGLTTGSPYATAISRWRRSSVGV